MTFSSSNGGCFMLHWSDTPVEGALASFVPKTEVARFKFTVLILAASISKTNEGPLPYVQSDRSVQDKRMQQVLAMGLKRGRKKKRKKKKKGGASPAQ